MDSVSCGRFSGVTHFSKSLGGLSVILGGLSACNVWFLQQYLCFKGMIYGKKLKS